MIEGEEWKTAGYIGVPTAEDVKKYCHDKWRFIMELEHHAYPQDLVFRQWKSDGDLVELSSNAGGYGSTVWVKRTQIVLLSLVPNPAHLACKPPPGSLIELPKPTHCTLKEVAAIMQDEMRDMYLARPFQITKIQPKRKKVKNEKKSRKKKRTRR